MHTASTKTIVEKLQSNLGSFQECVHNIQWKQYIYSK